MTFYEDVWKKKTTEKRKLSSTKILQKKLIPVIISKAHGVQCENILPLNKFAAKPNMTWGQFIAGVRNKCNLEPSQALFFFVNDRLISCNLLMSQVYKKHKSEDLCLVIFYTIETVFGYT